MGLLNDLQPKLFDLQTNGSTNSKEPSDVKNNRNFLVASRTPIDQHMSIKEFSKANADQRMHRTGSVSIAENIHSITKNRVYNIGDLIDYKKIKTIKQ